MTWRNTNWAGRALVLPLLHLTLLYKATATDSLSTWSFALLACLMDWKTLKSGWGSESLDLIKITSYFNPWWNPKTVTACKNDELCSCLKKWNTWGGQATWPLHCENLSWRKRRCVVQTLCRSSAAPLSALQLSDLEECKWSCVLKHGSVFFLLLSSLCLLAKNI